MKNSKLITFFTLMIFFFSSCYKKKYEKCKIELTNCENFNCSSTNNQEDKKLNLDLRYNCSMIDLYQPMHLDLKNRFGIFAKMNIDTIEGTINSISFKITEAGCKKLYINKVTLLKERKDKKFHDLKIEIDTIQKEGIKVPFVWNSDVIKFNLNDIFDIHINPDGGIYSTKTNLDETGDILIVKEKKIDIMTTFGTEFCKTIIVNPKN